MYNLQTLLLRLDLSSAQGELAKACLAERVPYLGVTLSENHSTHLEMILTNYAVTLMQTEGSSFYRADAAGSETAGSNKRKGSGPGEGEPPKAKAKAKNKAKSKAKATQEEPAPEDDEANPEGSELAAEELPW